MGETKDREHLRLLSRHEIIEKQKVLEKIKDPKDIEELDADEIMKRQVEELEKEKKVDHTERAKRQEEIPLLKQQFEEFKEEAKQVWEEQEKERIENEKAQRENDVKNCDRMGRVRADKDQYLEGLLKERKNIFEKKLGEFNV